MQCIARYDVVHGFLNSEAISVPEQFVRLGIGNWDRTLATNLTGIFLACKEGVPYITRRKKGSIVSLSSVNAQFGAKQTAHYCAAKAGIDGLSKAVPRELGSYNIRVNVVAPGFIDAAMLGLMPISQNEKLVKRIPLRRLDTREDLVGIVLFLAGSASGYIAGQLIGVGGSCFIC